MALTVLAQVITMLFEFMHKKLFPSASFYYCVRCAENYDPV